MTRWSPTQALGRALAVGGGLLFAAVLAGRPDLLVLAAPLIFYAAMAIWHRPREVPHIDTQSGARTVREGGGTDLITTVVCADVEQVTRLMNIEPFVVPVPQGGVVSAIARAGRTEATLTVSPRRWGVRQIGEGQVALMSRWGGYTIGPIGIPASTLVVLPEPAPFDVAAPAPHPVGVVGVHRSLRHGDGSELSGIRVYTPGDRLRRIHWRSSLRTRDLQVVTTYAEDDAEVLLLLDATTDLGATEGVDGTASSLDTTVRAAAALAGHYLSEGDRVGLRLLGGNGLRLASSGGSRHQRRLLEMLARVRPAPWREPETTVTRLGVETGTVVLVLSPMLSPAIATLTVSLARRGLPVVVVDTLPADAHDATAPRPSPDRDRDPAEFVARAAWRIRMLERDQQLLAIARTGTPLVTWRGPGTLDEVLHRLARRAAMPRMARR